MSDIIELGEPDVIRNEDNILWLRAEIERLTAECCELRATNDATVARLNVADARVETLETRQRYLCDCLEEVGVDSSAALAAAVE